MRADLVIVGCGIAGATLALVAGRRGRRVVLLDPDPLPQHHAYPEILWRASLDAFDRLGVGAQVRRSAGVPLRGLEVSDREGRRVLRVGSPALRDEEVEAWSTEPTATRRILLEAALATGCVDHHGGVTATRFLRDAGGGVSGIEGEGRSGRLVVDAPLVAGADGAASVVRRMCGIPLPAEDFPLAFVVAQGPAPPGLRGGVARARIDAAGFRRGILASAMAPLPEGRAGAVLLVHPESVATPPGERFREAAVALEPALEAWRELSHARVLRRRVGHAAAYAREGVALLGDAAHPVSPLGGQGADMAIADALAFDAHVLARTPPGTAPAADALRAYERARRQPNERGLRSSRRGDRLLRMARRAPLAGPLALATMRIADRLPGLHVWLARKKATAAQDNGRT